MAQTKKLHHLSQQYVIKVKFELLCRILALFLGLQNTVKLGNNEVLGAVQICLL
jgi:hypothetical protein